MGAYIIKITNGSDVGTIENQIDVGFRYVDKLNSINEADIKISGLGSVKRGLLSMGASIEIFRNTTLEFKGLLDSIDFLDGGAVNFHVSGKEIRLVQEKGSYANSPWKSVASATINTDIIGESNYFTAGTVESGIDIYFRLDKAQSLWGAMGNLSTKTGQDIQIDYVNDEIDILDHQGSVTSVATFNDGLQLRNLRVTQAYPKGNWVKVYGKGDGVDQIESDDAQGQDASSQSTYGVIKEVIIDRSIITIAEANSRANIEVAKIKDPTKVYDFECNNPNESVSTGDIITLNSQDKGLVNEEVRIVGMERGVRGNTEYLSLQVTNAAYSQLMHTSNELLGKLKREGIDSGSYMQGSGNLSQWEGIINATNAAGLRIPFYLGSRFEDEAGNLRVDSITIDYDVDPYRKEFGTASETNKDPSIDNGTFSSSDNESVEVDDDTSFNNAITFTDAWATYKSWTNIGYHGQAIIFHVHLMVNDWNNPTSAHSAYCRIYHSNESDYYPSTTGIRLLRGASKIATTNDTHNHSPAGTTYFMESDTCANWDTCSTATASDTHNHSAYTDINGTATIYVPIDPYNQDFHVQMDHTDSGSNTASFFAAYYIVGQHKHGDGDYKTDLHKHDVSIGDGVSDAGSLNASQVSIYLEKWNTGTSNWDVKHSVVNTGKTLDTDVDLSDSDSQPDSTGWWRIRIMTNHASPDLVQAIVSVKHHMDN